MPRPRLAPLEPGDASRDDPDGTSVNALLFHGVTRVLSSVGARRMLVTRESGLPRRADGPGASVASVAGESSRLSSSCSFMISLSTRR